MNFVRSIHEERASKYGSCSGAEQRTTDRQPPDTVLRLRGLGAHIFNIVVRMRKCAVR